MRRHIFVLVAICWLTGIGPAMAQPLQLFDDGLKNRMQQLLNVKNPHIADMANMLSSCLNQRDSRRGAFAGCGSRLRSIQAVWGVMSYSWLTGDKRYLTQIRQRLSSANLRKEWRRLQQGKEQYSAYEKSWFLRLTLDHMRIFNSKDLVPIGDWMAQSLIDDFNKSGIDPALSGQQDAAWILLALHGYAAERNEVWFTWVYDKLRNHFSDNSEACDFDRDARKNAGELSWCGMRIVAGHRINEQALYAIWLDGFIAADATIVPVRQPGNDDALSVNFVRAAAFWRAFASLKQEKWAKLYLDHIEQGLNYDLGNINKNSNHAAAFGILSLAPLWYLQENGPT